MHLAHPGRMRCHTSDADNATRKRDHPGKCRDRREPSLSQLGHGRRKPTFGARSVGKVFTRRRPPAQVLTVQECTVYRNLAEFPLGEILSHRRNSQGPLSLTLVGTNNSRGETNQEVRVKSWYCTRSIRTLHIFPSEDYIVSQSDQSH